MANGQQQAPQTFEDVTRAIAHAAPEKALEIVLSHTQAVQAAYEREKMELREQAEVKINPHGGIEATNMAGLYRIARMFAESDMVPDHFKRNVPNCFIAIQMALRCGVDPMAFLQKCYLVHGRPAIESQLAIAMANKSDVFKGRIKYQLSGEDDSRACRAYATLAETDETVEWTVDVAQAKAMGWWDQKGSLWPKMTDLMLTYRSAMWLIRTQAPEVLMGLLSKDEAEDRGLAPSAADGEALAQTPQSLDDLVTARQSNGSTHLDDARQHLETARQASDSPVVQALAEKLGTTEEPDVDPDTGLAPGETVDDAGEIHKANPNAWRGESIVQHAKDFGHKNVSRLKSYGVETLGQLYDTVSKGTPDTWEFEKRDFERVCKSLDAIVVEAQMAADGVT